MADIPAWQPLTTYSPGAQVTRATVPPVEVPPPVNGDFEAGAVDWTIESAGASPNTWVIQTHAGGDAFDGIKVATLQKTKYGPGTGKTYKRLYNAAPVPARVGQTITAWCMVQQGGASAGEAGAYVQLEWLDASLASLRIDNGNAITSGSDGKYKRSEVTATAPAGTMYVRLGAAGYQNVSARLSVDKFQWDYSFRTPFTSFVYTAVQAADGVSAATEPNWPSDPDTQVNDGTVIWQAVYGSSVEWEAFPIFKTGLTEPVWPTQVGSAVIDGSIVWTAASRRITDSRCPNSKVVAIAASKIFAANDDIIAYSATVNPLDWTTVDDAGYLPFGLQTHGSNPVSAMGLYRGNLVAFNSAGFQMWQVDQDPANMALLDAAPIGSTEARGIKPLQNDLIFLNAVGVRNISIAGASTNLQAGSTGEPVDELVQPELRYGSYDPISAFYPAYGQYWCIFGPTVFVLTLNEGKNGKWSRYVFPEAITDVTLLDNDLYVRTATHKVWRVTEDYLVDDYYMGTGIEFYGVVQWPHLDFGALGQEKQFIGFDLIATAPEGVAVSIGYDQRDLTYRTTDYTLDANTLPGKLVPIPVTAPSFDFRLTFQPNQAWEWFASVLYINDLRAGS
jgi:hypothetical protein